MKGQDYRADKTGPPEGGNAARTPSDVTESTGFCQSLDDLLRALASERQLYVPKRMEAGFALVPYEPGRSVELNDIRPINPVKEFVLPIWEPVASIPSGIIEGPNMEPFAIVGLKACDLRAIDVLDKVFLDPDLQDRFYLERRDLMMLVCSDCLEPAQSCFCNLTGGHPYPQGQFDLNLIAVRDGFVVEAGSQQGKEFMQRNAELFKPVEKGIIDQIQQARARADAMLAQINQEWREGLPARALLERGYDDEVFEEQGSMCVECQACTRVCPTCHCFYLYDGLREEYFLRMKMWDSCIRKTYAQVAGGLNPRRMLSDRLRHRMMHKFVYFPDRYGLQMCVGCGRCIEAEVGGVDMRAIFRTLRKNLSQRRSDVNQSI